MTSYTPTEKELTYRFRGKTFLAVPSTIQKLNYALALNRSPERYELVTPKKDGK